MFIYAADIHLTDKQPINRVTPVQGVCIGKFKQMLSYARQHNCSLVLGGDLFENPCPSYSVYSAVVNAINAYDVPVYCILGNHDIVYGDLLSENNAIRALINSGHIMELTENPNYFIHPFGVCGISYKKELYDNYTCSADGNILVTHQFLATRKLPYAHVLVQDFKTNASIVLCSHLHTPFAITEKNVHYLNPGCICRLNRNEQDIIPSCYLIKDDGNWERLTIDPVLVEFNKEEAKKVEFVRSVDDAKVEQIDIYSYIDNSDAEQPVKLLAKKLIKEVHGDNYDS